MKNKLNGKAGFQGLLAVGLMAMVAMIFMVQPVFAQDLEELLEQVGEDYAISYSSPFLYAFGPNQNASGSSLDLATPSDRQVNSQGNPIGESELNLAFRAGRAQDPN